MRMSRRKLKLRGFNNLTKSLSFNIYDICYARSRDDRNEYLAYIDEVYNVLFQADQEKKGVGC